MINNRIMDHPIQGRLKQMVEFTFIFDEKKYLAYEGDTIASALLANGVRTLRFHEKSATPRGIYCNIGHCMECRLTVNGTHGLRACLTEVKPDMVVETQKPKSVPIAKHQTKSNVESGDKQGENTHD